MAEFLDYDPHTGITHTYDFNEETGEAQIHYEADVSALLDYNKALASSGLNDRGIKQSWWTYAKLPPIWYIKLRARGFKLDGTDDTQRLLAEINTHAPALKCTQLNHGKKLKVVHDLGSKITTEST
jgi:hypothetical protein